MEDQHSPFSWDYLDSYAQEDQGMEEVKQALLYTAMELDNTIELANEEIKSRDLQLLHLTNLLTISMRERDEALTKCQWLLSSQNPSSCPSSSSPSSSSVSPLIEEEEEEAMGAELPEKGKLLEAVMEAGPLLQTLLMADPLPQWHHPPPKTDPSHIPIAPFLAFEFEPCDGFGNSLGHNCRKLGS